MTKPISLLCLFASVLISMAGWSADLDDAIQKDGTRWLIDIHKVDRDQVNALYQLINGSDATDIEIHNVEKRQHYQMARQLLSYRYSQRGTDYRRLLFSAHITRWKDCTRRLTELSDMLIAQGRIARLQLVIESVDLPIGPSSLPLESADQGVTMGGSSSGISGTAISSAPR